jgi:uncharacterized protein (DUF736 family)
MTPTLGTLERHPDGVLSGVFRTLIIRAQIELRPLPTAQGVQPYEVVAGPEFQLGVGRQPEGAVTAPIELRLNAPELARPVHARAVCVGGEAWVIVWLDG